MTTEQLALTAVGGLWTIVTAGVGTWMRAVSRSVVEIKEQGAETNKSVAIIQTTLVGANGDNGINSEVKALRHRVHKMGDELHSVSGRVEVLRVRVDNLEDGKP